MAEVLRKAMDDPSKMIVRGAPVEGLDLKQPHVRRKNGRPGVPETLISAARSWGALDLDDIEVPEPLGNGDQLEAAAYFIRDNLLPEEFRGVRMITCATSNTGRKGATTARLRLFFLLDRAVPDANLAEWAKATRNALNLPIDDAVFRAAQPIYTARPIFEGGAVDPVPVAGRVVLLQGERDPVSLKLDRFAREWEKVVRKIEGARKSADGDWQKLLAGTLGENGFYEPLITALGLAARSEDSVETICAVVAGLLAERADAARQRQYGAHWVTRAVEGFRKNDEREAAAEQAEETEERAQEKLSLEDFYAFAPKNQYIYIPTRDLWPAPSVDSRIAALVPPGQRKKVKASLWLARNRSVEQMTWAPGLPQVIRDRVINDGGWNAHEGAAVFNRYLPPNIKHGDAAGAQKWIDHVHRLYPNDADHIIAYLAHRVQRPGEKINHALLLGGAEGIGKDTILEGVRMAVGDWNWVNERPKTILESAFNTFAECVVLVVHEVHDLGEHKRFEFHDHMKIYCAAPPVCLPVNPKNLPVYYIPNVVSPIMTTNHRLDGLYLPPGDRRTYAAWSELTRADFSEEYWKEFYAWYEGGGYGHVAAYLATFDLSNFNPKAPPLQTAWFWEIVNTNRPPEEAELADVIDKMDDEGKAAFTLDMLKSKVPPDSGAWDWLRDRTARRQIPHRLEKCGYRAVSNPDAKDGQWVVGDKRQMIYAQKDKSLAEQLAAARRLVDRGRKKLIAVAEEMESAGLNVKEFKRS